MARTLGSMSKKFPTVNILVLIALGVVYFCVTMYALSLNFFIRYLFHLLKHGIKLTDEMYHMGWLSGFYVPGLWHTSKRDSLAAHEMGNALTLAPLWSSNGFAVRR